MKRFYRLRFESQRSAITDRCPDANNHRDMTSFPDCIVLFRAAEIRQLPHHRTTFRRLNFTCSGSLRLFPAFEMNGILIGRRTFRFLLLQRKAFRWRGKNYEGSENPQTDSDLLHIMHEERKLQDCQYLVISQTCGTGYRDFGFDLLYLLDAMDVSRVTVQ